MKRLFVGLLLAVVAGCATTREEQGANAGAPTASATWPPGIYAVSGRAEIPDAEREAPEMRSFLGTLLVAAGGDVQLVGCGAEPVGRPTTRTFTCGGETWSFTTYGEIIRGRVSTTVTVYVDSGRTECIRWVTDDQGRRTSCARWQKEPPRPRRRRISADLYVTLKS